MAMCIHGQLASFHLSSLYGVWQLSTGLVWFYRGEANSQRVINEDISFAIVRLRCANRTYNGFANVATIFSTLWTTDRVALSSP
jgi:hypothetical protein